MTLLSASVSRSRRTALTALCILAFLCISCGAGKGNRLREASMRRECRANMNALATDQALYRLNNGVWARRMEDLDELANRDEPLACPECGRTYELEITSEGYAISCPMDKHGRIETGIASWREGVVDAER
ncbi:hypothetical protein GF402_06075 [Candidatus Fermentibacteria bacterium]|nr:hypothetical protein [Candidatus Fermentibacteria bacterium]